MTLECEREIGVPTPEGRGEGRKRKDGESAYQQKLCIVTVGSIGTQSRQHRAPDRTTAGAGLRQDGDQRTHVLLIPNQAADVQAPGVGGADSTPTLTFYVLKLECGGFGKPSEIIESFSVKHPGNQ